MGEFTQNDRGVHVWSPINSEYTLCGDAFDAPGSEAGWPDGPFVETNRKTVTCPKCAAVINYAKTLKVRIP